MGVPVVTLLWNGVWFKQLDLKSNSSAQRVIAQPEFYRKWELCFAAIVERSHLSNRRWKQLRGDIRPVKGSLAAKELVGSSAGFVPVKEYADDMLLLITSIEICDLIGPAAALEHLQKFSSSSCDIRFALSSGWSVGGGGGMLPKGGFVSSAGKSCRFAALIRELTKIQPETRVLVFVDAREAAALMCEQLLFSFHTFNPSV